METKEFNFEEAYNAILKRAESCGMSEDMIFQTTMKEFRRMKELCDRMAEDIEMSRISDDEMGSKGQYTHKTNPVIRDYVTAHKALISTSMALKEMLAKVGSEDDWL